MSTRWLTEKAWLGGPDLTPGVVIEVDEGFITEVSKESHPGDIPLAGVTMPGLVNAHSHAFHRVLRGRTHGRGGDFWVWRETMYDVAANLTPESYERLATAVFIEMAMAGITAVGEFHYLHHQSDGVAYDDPNEMGHALIRAARAAGIRIALLDAGYFRPGFGDDPLHPVQRRFSDGSVAAWLDRVSTLTDTYRDDADVVIGLAPHSVRAVPAKGLEEVARKAPPKAPVHIHVSEQPAENDECRDAMDLTPTGLLKGSGLLGRPNTTLVHATHLTEKDIGDIGDAGATVCYCTTTERDLADGIGPASALMATGAAVCVGTDSHAVIDIFEEVRGMEMHQRLATGHRGVISPTDLALAATTAGSRSLAFPDSAIAVGAPADFIVIDAETPRLAGLGSPGTIDEIVFSATSADVTDVFVAGGRIVSRGSHQKWDQTRDALRLDR